MTTTTWKIDPSHSEATFTVRHMVVAKVRGAFRNVTGTVELKGEDIRSGKAVVEIDAASIDTREEKRDAHLKSEDFFWAEKHPKLVFRSKEVEGSGKQFKLHGELEMRGVAKPVVLNVEDLGKSKDPWGQDRLIFHAETKVNRKDWGLNWNQALEMGGVLVSDEVLIDLEVQMVKA